MTIVCLSDKYIPRKKTTEFIKYLLYILIVAYNGDTEIQNSEPVLKILSLVRAT